VVVTLILGGWLSLYQCATADWVSATFVDKKFTKSITVARNVRKKSKGLIYWNGLQLKALYVNNNK